jgi:superfamily I DNA and RNA helicase
MSDTWWLDRSELNDEQEPIIDLPIGKSYLITGPPGSGKTNLVLLRANYLYLSGFQSIEVVVFTRTLREFIASGGGQYDFPARKVKTSTRFFQDVLRKYGVPFTVPNKFPEARKYLFEETSELVEKQNLADLFEAILLDEGHSFYTGEIELFSRLAKTMFIASDARQKIYAGADCSQALRDAVDVVCAPLECHYRIGRKICKVADALMSDSPDYVPMLDASQYDEVKRPSHVDLPFACHSAADEADRIVKSLKHQLKTYPDEYLAVLSPTHKILAEVRRAIGASDIADECICQGDTNAVTFTPEKKIVVCTIHAAQGVEFRAVHIAGADQIERLDQHRNAAFTAVTRAKTSLSVYHTGTLPGYFAQALQAAQPPKEPATVDAVFGRKKRT